MNTSHPTISACLVIHNEDALLRRCLESIRTVAGEIIVVHDGDCTDDSLKIATEYGAIIFQRPFVGEAEHHRPFSYEQAKGEWVLQIDADEYLPENSKEKIDGLVRQSKVDGYHFYWPYPDGKGGYISQGPFSKTYKACLFRKSKMYMIGISHEYPRTIGVLRKTHTVQLFHQPTYDNYSVSTVGKKWKTWAALQAKQIRHIEKASYFGTLEIRQSPIFSYYDTMRRHPILSGLKENLRFVLLYIVRGILWSDIRSLRIAFLELRYLWMVRYYLLHHE